MTCVDCQVSFYGDDYAAHVTCISEAEKYEKSLFKPKAGKPKAQDIWNELIEGVVAMKSKAPPQVQPYLERISNLTNVPRNQKKFLNFARNSLNIRSDSLLEMIWKFLDGCRVDREKELEKETASPPSSSGAKVEKVAEPSPAVAVVEEKESKKTKKEKRKLEEVVAEVKPDAVSEEVVENDEQKKKKKKKDKKEKEEVAVEEEVEEKKKEKKEKKEKKSKKEKA